MPENKNYEPIKVSEDQELLIWGIVTYVVKKVWRIYSINTLWNNLAKKVANWLLLKFMFVVCVAKKSSEGDPTSIKLNKRNSYFSVKALILKSDLRSRLRFLTMVLTTLLW